MSASDRRVPFVSGRFRLLLQTPTAKDAGQWWPTPIVGDAIVDRSVSLSPVEAAIAGHLGRNTGELVDVEVESRVQGLSPAFPWLVSAKAGALKPRIAALLPPAAASWDDVEAAFLGLTADTFTWHPLKAGAMRPPLDQALRAIAHHAAPMLMTATTDGWVMSNDEPSRLDISLDVPGVQAETVGYRWSFSQFLASQPDPKRHLVDLAIAGPFAASVISIANDMPLAADGIRSVIVEVKTGGPTGMLHHEFLPGEPSVARLKFVTETFDETTAQWRARFTVMTANGPVVEATDFRAAGQTIEVNTATLGLHALRFAADANVFDHVAAVEVLIGSRAITLTRSAPVAWAVGRRPPASAAITAVLPAGTRHAIGTLPIGRLGLTIDLAMLGIGESAAVTLEAPADRQPRVVYLGVQVDGQPWRTLDAGSRILVRTRRQGRWQQPQVKYRTRSVQTDAASGLVETGWRNASGDTVIVEP